MHMNIITDHETRANNNGHSVADGLGTTLLKTCDFDYTNTGIDSESGHSQSCSS